MPRFSKKINCIIFPLESLAVETLSSTIKHVPKQLHIESKEKSLSRLLFPLQSMVLFEEDVQKGQRLLETEPLFGPC